MVNPARETVSLLALGGRAYFLDAPPAQLILSGPWLEAAEILD